MPHDTSNANSPIGGSVHLNQPLNLTMGLRLEAAQVIFIHKIIIIVIIFIIYIAKGILEALRTGLREGETKDNEAVILLQYALHVLELTPEQMVDEGNYG